MFEVEGSINEFVGRRELHRGRRHRLDAGDGSLLGLRLGLEVVQGVDHVVRPVALSLLNIVSMAAYEKPSAYWFLRSVFTSRRSLALENLALRQQLATDAQKKEQPRRDRDVVVLQNRRQCDQCDQCD